MPTNSLDRNRERRGRPSVDKRVQKGVDIAGPRQLSLKSCLQGARFTGIWESGFQERSLHSDWEGLTVPNLRFIAEDLFASWKSGDFVRARQRMPLWSVPGKTHGHWVLNGFSGRQHFAVWCWWNPAHPLGKGCGRLLSVLLWTCPVHLSIRWFFFFFCIFLLSPPSKWQNLGVMFGTPNTLIEWKFLKEKGTLLNSNGGRRGKIKKRNRIELV